MENIRLAEFDINVDAVVKSAAELKKSIDAIKQAQKENTLETDDQNEAYVQNEAALKSLNKEYSEHIKAINAATTATVDAANRQELMNVVLSQEVTTIAQAREQNKLLNKLRNEANTTTAEGQAEITRLNNALDANNDFIKDNVDALSQQKINVGNYTESIKIAYTELEKEKIALEENNKALVISQQETEKGSKEWSYFNQQIQQNNQQINVLITNMGGVNDEMQASSTITNLLSGNFKALSADAEKVGGAGNLVTSTLKGTAASIWTVIKASLAFLATPIGAVIGLIGLALGLVVNALTSTQSGMDKVTAVTRPLTAVLEVLMGVIQDIGLFLIEAFQNPQKTISELYSYIKDKVMKQFEGLYDIIVGIATLDFEQAKKGVKTLGDNAKDVYGDIADAAGKFNDKIAEGIRLGKELDRLTKEYEQTQIRNAELVPQLNAQLKEQNKIAEDQTKTQVQREQAAVNSIALAKEINNLKKEELGLELAILENEASRNDTSREELLKIAELKGKIADVDAQTAELETTQQNKLNGIRKEAEAQRQKFLDEQIKKQKELLDLFIAEQGERARTLQEELILEETLSTKRKAILDEELKAKKLSQEAYKTALIEIDTDLAKRRSELAVDNAMREIEANRMSLEKQREDKLFLSQELANQRKLENETILLQEQELAKLRLQNGLINQQEFDDAIRELSEINRIANKEIDAEREAIEKQERAELRALEFEEDLAKLLEEGATKFEVQQLQNDENRQLELQKLAEQREQGALSEELYNARLNNINKKYDKIRKDQTLANEKALAQQRLDIASQMFGALGVIVDKNSSFGKALAVSQALINTYKGITSALETPSLAGKIAGVAMASATGFKAVKDILSTKVPKADGGTISGGASASVGNASTDLRSLASNESNLSRVSASGNATVQQQIETNANQSGLSESVSNAVAQGAEAGTRRGSEQGLTNLSDNRNIRALSTT